MAVSSVSSSHSSRKWAGVAALASLLSAAVACGGSSANDGLLGGSGAGTGTGTGTGNGGAGSGPQACTPCTTNADCGQRICAQFQGDTFCAPACPNGDECGSGTTCTAVATYSGDQESVCEPANGVCGTASTPPSSQPDAAAPPASPTGGGCTPAPVQSCGSLVPPQTASSCTACTKSTSTKTCQPNGCYGGWWCDSATSRCQQAPTSCTGGSSGGTCDAGSSPPPPPVPDGGTGGGDAGVPPGPVSGTIGPTGGTVSRLYFTAVGDTRPATIDDTSGYPSTIINQIYTDIQGLNPRPPFSVSTGDYQFSSANGTQSGTQMNLYMAARAKFTGAFFPALGNHECTGATASNCGTGNTNGVTTNFSNFLSLMLGPIQKTQPYYSININAADGSWTSKFVFVAANAWDSTQSSWLSGVMAQATTYTFVIRHEATGTSGPPGVSPSDAIINGFPYTLLIVGHTHTYEHKSTREVLFGNGGAPLTGSGNYGFGLFSQRSDGAIVVDSIDYQSLQADSSFHFVVTPTGALTQ